LPSTRSNVAAATIDAWTSALRVRRGPATASAAREHGGDPLVARVVVAPDAAHPAQDLGDVERGPGGEHEVDVDPLLRPVERRLAHQQVLGRQDRDGRVGEGDDLPSGGGVVKGVVGEEEVDRTFRLCGPQPHLVPGGGWPGAKPTSRWCGEVVVAFDVVDDVVSSSTVVKWPYATNLGLEVPRVDGHLS